MPGSETRQRGKTISFRCSIEEFELINALSDMAGVSLAAFCRARALNKLPSRAARRPTINQQEVARLIGQLGSLQQTIEQTSQDADQDARFIAIADSLSAMRDDAMRALGRKP